MKQANQVFKTICPFCKKEVLEGEEILVGNVDDVTTFDMNETPKTFFHVKCFTEHNNKEC